MKFVRFLLLLLIIPMLSGCGKEVDNGETLDEPFDKVVQIIAVHNTSVWVGTYQYGLYKLEGDNWVNYTTSDGLVDNEITALVFDNNDFLWVGTKMGLSKLENGNWTSFTTEDGLYSNDIRSLECDEENNIWIGTNQNRITRFDGVSFTAYHVNPEFSGEQGIGHIHSITSDLEGNIWVGSCSTGLSRFDGETWYDHLNDLTTFVETSVCTEDGDVWIGHYTGAYEYSGDIWTRYSEENGLADQMIFSMDIDQQQNIWIGTEHGVSRFNGNTWENFTVDSGLFNDYITCLACDPDGAIWIGNSNGLLKYIPVQ